MGAWQCPECGHGRYYWIRATVYCRNCPYQVRRDQMLKENGKK